MASPQAEAAAAAQRPALYFIGPRGGTSRALCIIWAQTADLVRPAAPGLGVSLLGPRDCTLGSWWDMACEAAPQAPGALHEPDVF